jgi:hypothetical protein
MNTDPEPPPPAGITITGQALVLQPGDTLIIATRAAMSDWDIDRTKAKLKELIPDLGGVVIIGGIDQIAAYRPNPIEEQQ